MFRTLATSCLILAAAASAASAQSFGRVINFGDSLSDVGNTDSISFGFSPGSNYFDGRYSNGAVWAEGLAADLRLSAPVASRSGGLDYAVGGSRSGAGNVEITPFPFVTIRLPNAGTQIESFLAGNTVGPNDLVTLWTGANDLLDGSTSPTAAAANVKSHVERLVGAGVKNIVVANMPPLGETPRYRGTGERGTMNFRAAGFNSAIRTGLLSVAAASPGVTIYQPDIHGLFAQALSNPAAYGFSNVIDTALRGDGTVVPNPDQYLFYDNIHPTRTGHAVLADFAFETVTTRTAAGATTGAPGDWNTASSWAQHRVPDNLSAVSLTGTSAFDMTLNGSATVRKFTVGYAGEGTPPGGIAPTKFHLGGGTLTVSGGPAAIARGGVLVGRGTIGGELIVGTGANVSPGEGEGGALAIGQVIVTGGLDLSGGRIRFDLFNESKDHVVVLGAAKLNGTLGVRFIDGYIGLPETQFTLMNFASFSGVPNITNETSFAGLSFTKVVTATSLGVRLSATGGDANLDGAVDFADLVTVAQHYSQLAGQRWLEGDFNGDAGVDFDDLVILAQHYQSAATLNSDWMLAQALAPEPAVSLVLAILGMCRRNRRHLA